LDVPPTVHRQEAAEIVAPLGGEGLGFFARVEVVRPW
jgi:hypothetical protein